MQVRRDNKLNAFNVKIGEEELKRAFSSEIGLLIFMHTLVALTYGDDIAELTFPLHRKDDNT